MVLENATSQAVCRDAVSDPWVPCTITRVEQSAVQAFSDSDVKSPKRIESELGHYWRFVDLRDAIKDEDQKQPDVHVSIAPLFYHRYATLGSELGVSKIPEWTSPLLFPYEDAAEAVFLKKN